LENRQSRPQTRKKGRQENEKEEGVKGGPRRRLGRADTFGTNLKEMGNLKKTKRKNKQKKTGGGEERRERKRKSTSNVM